MFEGSRVGPVAFKLEAASFLAGVVCRVALEARPPGNDWWSAPAMERAVPGEADEGTRHSLTTCRQCNTVVELEPDSEEHARACRDRAAYKCTGCRERAERQRAVGDHAFAPTEQAVLEALQSRQEAPQHRTPEGRVCVSPYVSAVTWDGTDPGSATAAAGAPGFAPAAPLWRGS